MSFSRLLTACLVVCVLSALVGGCRTRRNKGTEELGPIDIIEGDYGLGSQDELGERIREVEFESVMFAFDSAQIQQSERGKIEEAANYLRRNRGVRVVLEGHCDERGSKEYNMALGERRALATRAYMIGLGIDGSLVLTKSYGEEQPLDFGHDESAWRLNRRVEFVMYR